MKQKIEIAFELWVTQEYPQFFRSVVITHIILAILLIVLLVISITTEDSIYFLSLGIPFLLLFILRQVSKIIMKRYIREFKLMLKEKSTN